MKTRGQVGPWTRTSLSWNGWRDARGQMQPNEPPPRAGTYESVASARRQAIAVDSARDMEQPSATLAQLCADQNFLNDMLHALPEPQPCAEKPDTAVDAIAVTIRANARLAERRLALTEQLHRLVTEEASLRETIEARKRSAAAAQDAETEFGKACRDIYLAAFHRHATRRSK